MRILGIETSCDETAIAVLEATNDHFGILSNVVSSQVNVHKKWGGVVPNLARREHEKNLALVLQKALEEAQLLRKIQISKSKFQTKSKIQNPKFQTLRTILEREPELYRKLIDFLKKYQTPDVDFIAAVNGPGLEPALWVGVNFAKALSFWWGKAIVPVNHLEGHLLMNWLQPIHKKSKIQNPNSKQNLNSKFQTSNLFPAICLLVSGGHTMLMLMRGIGEYKIIGETRDDSAGECFDKTARVLGLGYPGGPAIAKAATRALPKYQSQIKMPRPMIHSKDYDFSFSGLKTAVLYHYQNQPASVKKSKNYIYAMAAEIQQAIADVLIYKSIRAAKEYKARTVMLGGGVAANEELRCQLGEKLKKELPNAHYVVPEQKLCTDNGVMAAVAGYFAWQKRKREKWQKIEARANLKL